MHNLNINTVKLHQLNWANLPNETVHYLYIECQMAIVTPYPVNSFGVPVARFENNTWLSHSSNRQLNLNDLEAIIENRTIYMVTE